MQELETLKLLAQTLGQGLLGLIAFWLYHRFSRELLAQNAQQHERQHEQEKDARETYQAFIKDLFSLVVKQQRDYEDLLQTAISAEEDKHRFFRLALDTFNKIGACNHARNPEERANPEAQD